MPTCDGSRPVAAKVPLPLFRSTLTVLLLLFATTRSGLPSLFRSAAAIDVGCEPVGSRPRGGTSRSRCGAARSRCCCSRSRPRGRACRRRRGPLLPRIWGESPIASVGGNPATPVHTGETHAPATQLAPPLQITGFSPTHAPAWQVSVLVQASESSHAVPAARAAVPHIPALHVAVTHSFGGSGQSCGVAHGMPPPAPADVDSPPEPAEVAPPPEPAEVAPPPHPAARLHSPRTRARTLAACFMRTSRF